MMHFWFVIHILLFCCVLRLGWQKTALAKDEQNRLASEEAEKRLKAALTAKREPSAAVSRVASPAVISTNPSEANDEAKAESGNDDVAMEVEPAATSIASEVRCTFLLLYCDLITSFLTEPMGSRTGRIIR